MKEHASNDSGPAGKSTPDPPPEAGRDQPQHIPPRMTLVTPWVPADAKPYAISEEDIEELDRVAVAAMVAAYTAISNTATQTRRAAKDAQDARVVAVADLSQALADLVAQAASAFRLRSEVSILKAGWVASRAAHVISEAGQPNAPSHQIASNLAETVRVAVSAAVFEHSRAAERARWAAISAAQRLTDAAQQTDIATELETCHQNLAIQAIAFDTSLQVAVDAAENANKASPEPVPKSGRRTRRHLSIESGEISSRAKET